MGGRYETESPWFYVRPTSVSIWLLAGLRQESDTNAKGEQLSLCRLSG